MIGIRARARVCVCVWWVADSELNGEQINRNNYMIATIGILTVEFSR